MSRSPSINVLEIKCVCLDNALKITKRKSEFDIEEIITRYRPVISFKVRKSLGYWTPDWEDVVNEIILNIVEKLKKGEFRGDSSIGTFIYTITSRRIVDFIRNKTKVLKHAPEPVLDASPQEEVENRERAEFLAQAIEKLKPKYKEVLYLYYYKELPREEVARRLSIPPSRVSERINYAQKLLKKIIKK